VVIIREGAGRQYADAKAAGHHVADGVDGAALQGVGQAENALAGGQFAAAF